MFSDKVFQITLGISLAIHGAILIQNSHISVLNFNKKDTNLQVSYIKTPAQPKKEPKALPPNKERLLKLPAKISAQEKILPQGGKIPSSVNLTLNKPTLNKPDIIAVKKKITLPPMEMDINKISNPSYISYSRTIREKIKHAAYQYYTGKEQGKVTVSFLLSQAGDLGALRIIDEESSHSIYLREIVSGIIKYAAPFPRFPTDLNYPELSFKLTIIFETE